MTPFTAGRYTTPEFAACACRAGAAGRYSPCLYACAAPRRAAPLAALRVEILETRDLPSNVPFSAVLSLVAVNTPRGIHTADLDGDGDLDIVAASYDAGSIVWSRNNGNGSFGTQQLISNQASGARWVTTADLDGDGDLDVLSGDRNGSHVAWYANDGAGNFGSQQIIYTPGTAAVCVEAGDIDRDGDMDVAFVEASVGSNGVSWMANDGTGHFGPKKSITTNVSGIRTVQLADLDLE